MSKLASFAPAFVWRAFCFFTLPVGGLLAATPPAPAPGLAQIGKPDAAESRRILAQFRQAGITGDYFLTFELHQLPREGDERVYSGRLWGGRNARGALTRISLTDGAGRERRLLVQNGDQPAVWSYADGKLTQPGMTALLAPLVEGVELSAFDLEMPFVAWTEVECTAIVRVLGRPAYAFLFRPPAEFAARYPEPAAVRAYFDAQFNAPTQTELVDVAGRVTKTLSLVELKRIDRQWIPKTLEVRNETTRAKTRFLVTAAALGLEFTAGVFEPAALADEVRPPAADRLVRIIP
jgi:hypothetical protein